jgi:hypothetical protein
LGQRFFYGGGHSRKSLLKFVFEFSIADGFENPSLYISVLCGGVLFDAIVLFYLMLLLELLTAFDIAMGFQTHHYAVITSPM